MAIHLAALAVMVATEVALVQKLVFALTWGVLNFFWLTVSRRPGIAAVLSLAMTVMLVLISQFKHSVLLLTANFLDVMIIDPDSIGFLVSTYPGLGRDAVIASCVAAPLLVVAWRMDPFRVRVRTAASGGMACLAAVAALSLAVPMEPWEGFFADSFVSKFVRSGVDAVTQLTTRGMLDSDAVASGHLRPIAATSCQPAAKRPHIVMVLDESSFDITAMPGVKVPPGYKNHFLSFDGKQRGFGVEGIGGPTWYTEYNVLTGLSARSFGRFAYYVTRIAAGRVERGLPTVLRRCGYKTFTLYPAVGGFLSARSFQKTTGVERFIDAHDMAARVAEPDSFYYDKTARLIERARGAAPLFVFVYLSANHFPWDFRFEPKLAPDWKDLGNDPVVDEYVRRQTMSARDYADFLARLKRDFPGESFLLVRFGDHQPDFTERLLDPSLDDAAIARRIETYDPRYFTTYYAIDTVNFTPVDLSSALDKLEAPYLPLVIQEAAGLPLDPSFVEQKSILQRCGGAFYLCNDGAEARRFNRLLIDAGLIKGL